MSLARVLCSSTVEGGGGLPSHHWPCRRPASLKRNEWGRGGEIKPPSSPAGRFTQILSVRIGGSALGPLKSSKAAKKRASKEKKAIEALMSRNSNVGVRIRCPQSSTYEAPPSLCDSRSQSITRSFNQQQREQQEEEEHEEEQEQEQEQEEREEEQEDQQDEQQQRKKRGPTKLPSLARKKKVLVTFNHRNQPIVENADVFSSFLGIMSREMVPITLSDWRQLRGDNKKRIWKFIEERFIILDKASHEKHILQRIGRLFGAWKSRLTKELENGNNEKPATIDEKLWKEFKKQRRSSNFREQSNKAKEIEQSKRFKDTTSRKGYARLEYEMASATTHNSAIIKELMGLREKYEDLSSYVYNQYKQGQQGGDGHTCTCQPQNGNSSNKCGMKCKLIDWVVGTHIVAEGEIAIDDPLHVVEGAPIGVGSYMVWVQTAIDHNALIWRTQANMRTIEQALGESIPWPKQHMMGRVYRWLEETLECFGAKLKSIHDASGIFEKYVKSWIAIAAPFQGAPGYITTSLLNGMSFVNGWQQNLLISKWSMHYGSEQAPVTDPKQIFSIPAKYICVDGDGIVLTESAKADGLKAVARVGVPGDHRGIIYDRHVFQILKHWLKADHDPYYNPMNDYVILPTAFEMEKFHEEGLEVTSLKEEWELISYDKSEPADKKPLVYSTCTLLPGVESFIGMDARSRELLKVFNVDGLIGLQPVIMCAGELESERAGEPGKLIRERYRAASQVVQNQVRSLLTFISDVCRSWVVQNGIVLVLSRLLENGV
ncbi:hypothetical protein Sjap_020169 [Stephania japonica]|uniref:Transposase Tnp1/En/Spm-like domain-containing protein n=1 Tax=Stephania japonica TaxID=461633 RepID=A0AAP0I080_9MAGN